MAGQPELLSAAVSGDYAEKLWHPAFGTLLLILQRQTTPIQDNGLSPSFRMRGKYKGNKGCSLKRWGFAFPSPDPKRVELEEAKAAFL